MVKKVYSNKECMKLLESRDRRDLLEWIDKVIVSGSYDRKIWKESLEEATVEKMFGVDQEHYFLPVFLYRMRALSEGESEPLVQKVYEKVQKDIVEDPDIRSWFKKWASVGSWGLLTMHAQTLNWIDVLEKVQADVSKVDVAGQDVLIMMLKHHRYFQVGYSDAVAKRLIALGGKIHKNNMNSDWLCQMMGDNFDVHCVKAWLQLGADPMHKVYCGKSKSAPDGRQSIVDVMQQRLGNMVDEERREKLIEKIALLEQAVLKKEVHRGDEEKKMEEKSGKRMQL